MERAFRHDESERTILFGREALAEARPLLDEGFTLLTTPRAAAAAPALVDRAGLVVEVPPGRVETVAADLRGRVRGDRLVALGGGRVVDVAKALAAADPPRSVTAVPTTLSGAEMTRLHRHAEGVPGDTPRVRPALVVNDPALSASQPRAELAAAAANAVGHALAALTADRTTPPAEAVARAALKRLSAGWADPDPARPTLALGALLAGWAVDHSGLGLHHVLAQSVVRTAGVGHARANVAVLPVTVAALRLRRPDVLAGLDAGLGLPVEALAARLRAAAGVDLLAPLADEGVLERTVAAAAARPELGRVAPPPDRAELRRLLEAAAAPSVPQPD